MLENFQLNVKKSQKKEKNYFYDFVIRFPNDIIKLAF